jgi:hypothetical protein
MHHRFVWFLAFLASALALPAGAQGTPVGRRNLLSVNPLGIPFEYFALEYESVVRAPFTLGLGASYLGPDDFTYATVEVKARLYPNEEAPKGFSTGLSFGFTHVSEDDAGDDRSDTLPTLGVIVDYNWLLGKTKRFLVGAGVGAKRLFGGDSDDFDDVNFGYPTIRFQIGIVF